MKQLLLFIGLCIFTKPTFSQNTGIGTASPSMALHISKPSDTALLLLENQTTLNLNINTGLYFKTGSSYTGALKTIGTAQNFARIGLFTYAVSNRNNLKERLSIMDDGKVGIGTIAPLSNLHVADASSSSLFLLEKTAALAPSSNVSMFFKNGTYFTGAIKSIGQDAQAARLGFFTSAELNPDNMAERLTIADDGNVAVGSTTPAMRFHVSTADSAVMLLEKSGTFADGSNMGMYFKNGSRFTGAIKTTAVGAGSARLSFYTYASPYVTGLQERLAIRDDGNVGINTPNPTAKLEVNGTTKMNGTVQIADGTQADGKILVSDANGNAKWGELPKLYWEGTTNYPATITFTSGSNITLTGTEYIDNSNSFNQSNGIFTVPQTGYYKFDAKVGLFIYNSNPTQNLQFQLNLTVNNTVVRKTVGAYRYSNESGAAIETPAILNTIVYLNAGDQVVINLTKRDGYATDTGNLLYTDRGTFCVFKLP